jgi:hypothetical protein
MSVSADLAGNLRVPVVDDEELARSELVYLLTPGTRIASVRGPQRREHRHGTDDRHGKHAA